MENMSTCYVCRNRHKTGLKTGVSGVGLPRKLSLNPERLGGARRLLRPPWEKEEKAVSFWKGLTESSPVQGMLSSEPGALPETMVVQAPIQMF